MTQTNSDLSYALTALPSITLGPVSSGSINLSINDATKLQKIDGFGAAFTDTSTYVLKNQLTSAAYTQVMNDLFTRSGQGIGLSFMRVPIAASDFTATPATAPAPYSYDDNGGVADPTLANFSIAHDQAYTDPVILQAQALNPQMKLFASQWSPPGWMKTDNTMIGTTGGTLLTSMYGPMATYQTKFLQAYAAAGIKVWGITPQNEPNQVANGYPGMILSAQNEANYIKNNLAPALASAGLSTKIIGGDNGGVDVQYATTLFNDATVKSDLYATGWHCYANNLGNLPSITALAPTKPTYETECSTGPGIAPMNAAQLALEAAYDGASGAQLWNLATDTAGGPKIGSGCGGCNGLVTVDSSTKTASYTSNFYQLGQFSKFVYPDATHVGSTDGGGVWSQAFQNADGSEALVAYNTNGSPTTFTTTWNNHGSFTYTLPGNATVTFSSSTSGTTPLPAIVGVASGRCLDNVNSTTNGTQQQLFDCATGAARQQYIYSSASELQTGGGCLGAAGNGTTNGTQVILWSCNSTASQKWTFNADGTIVNQLSGLCLDAAGYGTGNGTPIQLWACQPVTPTSANQQWKRSS